MNVVDKLLQLDVNKLANKPRKEVEIKSLTKLLGQKTVFTCQAIDGERYADIQKASVNINKKGGISDYNLFEMQVLTVIDGVVDPSLRDKGLLEHFNTVTPKELVKKLLLPGEIAEVYKVVNELSGYEDDETEKEIKN